MKQLTINQLWKQLGELIEQGHKRKPVCIDKRSFTHPLESDGCVILHVHDANIAHIDQCDDDGGLKENKDGSISSRTCLVLSGYDDSQGILIPMIETENERGIKRTGSHPGEISRAVAVVIDGKRFEAASGTVQMTEST